MNACGKNDKMRKRERENGEKSLWQIVEFIELHLFHILFYIRVLLIFCVLCTHKHMQKKEAFSWWYPFQTELLRKWLRIKSNNIHTKVHGCFSIEWKRNIQQFIAMCSRHCNYNRFHTVCYAADDVFFEFFFSLLILSLVFSRSPFRPCSKLYFRHNVQVHVRAAFVYRCICEKCLHIGKKLHTKYRVQSNHTHTHTHTLALCTDVE